MANVNYLCCPRCHGWYREGDAHMCGSGRHPDNMVFKFDPPIYEEPPVAVHQLVNSERLYTLLERIAVALEKLVEK